MSGKNSGVYSGYSWNAKELFQKVFESHFEAIFILNSEVPPKIIDCNEAAVAMFGYDKKDMLGSSTEFLHDSKSALKEFSAAVREAVKTEGHLAFYEFHLRKKDGTRIPTQHSVFPLKDPMGKVTGWVSAIAEISDKKRMIEERFRDFTESLPEVVIETDAYGNLLFVNKQAFKVFGYSREDFERRLNVLTMIALEDQARVKKNIVKVLQGEFLGGNEYKAIRKDGVRFPVVVYSRRIMEGDSVVGLRSIIIDVTEQKKEEAEKDKMRTKLEQYSKKLELKVKRLEKQNLSLTLKEKHVLRTMAAFPDMNDRELAKKTGVKRSTVTSIKNRLREEDIYSVYNVPDFFALGCELVTFVFGEYASLYPGMKKELEKRMPNSMICGYVGEKNFCLIFVPKDIVSFHKQAFPLINDCLEKGLLKEEPRIVQIPLALAVVPKLISYSSLLSGLFTLSPIIRSSIKTKPLRLSKNMKEIMYMLVKHPYMSSAEIAKHLQVTRPTVTNARNKLFEAGYLRRKIVPNIKKLKCGSVDIVHTVYAPGTTLKKRRFSDEPSHNAVVTDIVGERERLCVAVFQDELESADCVRDYKKFLAENHFATEEPYRLSIPVDSLKKEEFNFVKYTADLLDIDPRLR
ncbi:PAS domain S-box protein [Nanoarchaeota archaeon]